MKREDDNKSRIAVFADTHGTVDPVREALLRYGPFNSILHLGDGVEDGRVAADEAAVPFFGVAGNEDRHCDLEESLVFESGPWKMLLIHGHQVDINPYAEESVLERHYEQLAYMARRSGARILIFGHTHEPMVRVVNGIILCNPGSMYRGSSSPVTFGLIETWDGNISISVYARRFDGIWEKNSSFADYGVSREPAGKR